MRVTVSVAGVFHAYHLAEQLERHGALASLVTTYPPSYVVRRAPGVPPERVVSNRLQYLDQAAKRLKLATPALHREVRSLHDRFAARCVRADVDFFVGWSGGSLRALRRARRLGVTAVVVRGSSHIEVQRELLRAEYERHGLSFEFDPRVVEIDLAEYAAADYIQTNSSFAKRTMVERGIAEDRILVNNTGVDLRLFHPVEKEDRTFRVIYAGNLGLRKGSPYLLQAFRELDLPDAELWHLGHVSPEIRPFLERFGHPRLRLLGYKPIEELHRYYSQGSVFVLPSIEEGLAMVQAQAMACGLPLVCTPNTGGEDFLTADGVEGFVVPIRDVEALKERILRLYESPELCAEMGRAARARVSTGFTWDDYGDRMVALYRDVLAPGGAGRA